MAAINDLIAQVENPELRARLEQEVARLNKQKKFGLVFEEHMPECAPLYEMPIRRGSHVALRVQQSIQKIYTVLAINDKSALCFCEGDNERAEFSIADLVVVAQFGEPIYPYLKQMDSVCNAPDSDLWHTLIEADNYHALQLLEYLYAGQVDCIYIDPPYNTGAKDWKYNNDYVDASDSYRHSKWLSMMKKRLQLAKKLLNPQDSVLIVTIDEKEYVHLGCLLEELFPEARIQMITSMINKKGSTRVGAFSRRDEYLYFLFIGNAVISRTNDDMISTELKDSSQKAIWNSLLRRGADGSSRRENPNLFYPFHISIETGAIVGVGDPLPLDVSRDTVPIPEGTRLGWPIRSDLSEGRWQISANKARQMVQDGTMKAGKYSSKSKSYAINYLKKGQLEDLDAGVLIRKGTDEAGAGIFEYVGEAQIKAEPGTIWVREAHDASIYGSTLLRAVLPGRKFPFPKSLYAVEDALRFVVKHKPNALIIDFFAGSGTTLHAVNLLNAEDDGDRRCIMVTNNEISAEESKALTAQGLHPGDEKWDKLGIARFVTWPRTVCAIEGRDINGNPLKGNYIGSDRPMADGFKANAVFFKLGFLDKTSIALGRQFKELLPVLWMKAGAIGPCPSLECEELPKMLILPKNHFAVLLEETAFPAFAEELKMHSQVQMVYIITDYEAGYRSMAETLKDKQCCQLYRSYLENFRINQGRI